MDLLTGFESESFQLQFGFGNRKKSQGAKSGKYGGLGMAAILYLARDYWVRTEV
jgi:hypothetical protein